jgi:hypothetical protein
MNYVKSVRNLNVNLTKEEIASMKTAIFKIRSDKTKKLHKEKQAVNKCDQKVSAHQ